MSAIQLTPAQRKIHRAEAHHLDPVVMIGNDGLTPAVIKEAEMALNAHGSGPIYSPEMAIDGATRVGGVGEYTIRAARGEMECDETQDG